MHAGRVSWKYHSHDQIFQCFEGVGSGPANPVSINNNLQNNYLGYYPSGTLQNDETLKGDFNVSDKIRFFLLYQHGLSGNPTTVGGTQFTMPLPYASGRFGTTGTYLSQANVSTTISPSLVNVFAVSWNRFYYPLVNATTGARLGDEGGVDGFAGQRLKMFSRKLTLEGLTRRQIGPTGLNSTTFFDIRHDLHRSRQSAMGQGKA